MGFPHVLRKEGSLTSMDNGQPGPAVAWPGIDLSPLALRQGQATEGRERRDLNILVFCEY